MKIYSINNNSSLSNRNNYKNSNSQSLHNNPQFCGWNYSKLNILNGNDKWMRELGEYFHKFSAGGLADVATIKNFIGIKKSEASSEALQKLTRYVEEVRKNKNSWLTRISELAVKEAKQEQNITAEKLKVTEMFINMLDGGKVDNGILIHGTSKDKESFIDWLIKASGINFKEMEFNIQNPLKSLDEIIMYAKNAKQNKALTDRRTLLHVRNLDELLVDFETAENRRNISRLKRFMDNNAEAYDTTIVTSTNRLLEDFEDASIAPHRFGLKVALDEHITKEEKTELANLRNKVKALDEKAEKADSMFYESELSYEPKETYWGESMDNIPPTERWKYDYPI